MKSKRVPRILKWTSIPNDAAGKLCAMENSWEKGRLVAKPIAGKKENRSQANWKNTREVARTVT